MDLDVPVHLSDPVQLLEHRAGQRADGLGAVREHLLGC
jgi:hypothetical protein